MVRITDELLVSRAEHNDGHLSSLEEISLHQQKLERIEYINRVCGDLKILHFQDNCIEKMENFGRLKMLEYLNLAMNNIERIENTEPLEKLKKLDLTLNFVGELTSIEILRDSNVHLNSLFLMGNPCTKFTHYREFVLATLPQLEFLDGMPIEKSERIRAIQMLDKIKPIIIQQELEYLEQRNEDRISNLREVEAKAKEYDNPDLDLDTQRRRFYESASKHNPEYRKESMRFRQYLEEVDNEKTYPEPMSKSSSKRPRRLFDDNGRPLNVNEANVDFHYDDNDDSNLVIELKTYRYMDTSLIDLDVQPFYLRATINGKIFQLRFLEEVNPDMGKAKRSQTTGHIVVTIPFARSPTRPIRDEKRHEEEVVQENTKLLEVSPLIDLSRICHQTSEEEEPPPLEDAF